MKNHTKSTPPMGNNHDTADLPPDVQLALWAKEAAERGYYADQSADYRAKMVAECHRLINELIALQADLQRTVGGAA